MTRKQYYKPKILTLDLNDSVVRDVVIRYAEGNHRDREILDVVFGTIFLKTPATCESCYDPTASRK